jgi:hypothetical protein
MQPYIMDKKFSEMQIHNDQNIGENISMIKLMLRDCEAGTKSSAGTLGQIFRNFAQNSGAK